nr:probable pectate lyase 4 [Tanacetum cinerariifolium]
MVAGIKIALDVDSECEVVSADNAIHVGVSVSAGDVATATISPQTEFALMGASLAKTPNISPSPFKPLYTGMAVVSVVPYSHVDSSLQALAGQAEGFGRHVVGGLHGEIFHVTSLIVVPYSHVDSSLQALAGQAEGFGRHVVGGLHGEIFHVTSLIGQSC